MQWLERIRAQRARFSWRRSAPAVLGALLGSVMVLALLAAGLWSFWLEPLLKQRAHWQAELPRLQAQARALAPLLRARQAAGRVVEGHGDLHLGNLVLIDGHVTPFDCIEFNDSLRWIDVNTNGTASVMNPGLLPVLWSGLQLQ